MRKSLLPRLNPPDGDRENAQPSESEQGTEGLNEEEEQESLGRGRRVRKSNARYSEQLPPRTGRASRRSAPHDKASTTTSLENTAATSNTADVVDVAAEAATTESAAPSTAATKAPAAAVTMRSARSRASLVPPATSSAGQLKNTTKKGKRGRPSLIVPLTRPGQQEEEEKSKEEVRSAVDEDSRDSEVLLPGK